MKWGQTLTEALMGGEKSTSSYSNHFPLCELNQEHNIWKTYDVRNFKKGLITEMNLHYEVKATVRVIGIGLAFNASVFLIFEL